MEQIFEKTLDRSQFIYDGRGELPYITAPDNSDIDGFAHHSHLVRLIKQEGENYGFTLKFNYDLDSDGFFSNIDFGIHTDKTDLDVARSINQRYRTSDTDAPATAAELMEGQPAGTLPEVFLPGDNIGAIETWPIFDFNTVAAADPRLNNGWDELGVDNSEAYTMTETILAAFFQANIDTEVNGMALTGNVGVRLVQTDNESTAFETLDDIEGADSHTKKRNATWTPFTVSNSDTMALPSLNLNLALKDNMALRLGLSKTLSRPQYQNLAPISNIRLADEDGGFQKVNVGNPDLKPMTSENLDITFEWYTEYDGAFILSAFYKDVSDFIIQNTEVGVPYEDYEGLFDVKTYRNISKGTAQGYEIGLYQPLGKVFPILDGFGFQANYTYVDSEFETDVGDAGFGFPGSSKDNVNFIGFYEAVSYSIRLAYQYRGEYFRSLDGQGSQASGARFTGETESLNLSVRIRPPVDGLSIQLAANNLTDDTRRDFYGDGTFFDYFDRGRSYSATLTYQF